MGKSISFTMSDEATKKMAEIKSVFKINRPDIINKLIENMTEEQIAEICAEEIAAKQGKGNLEKMVSNLSKSELDRLRNLIN